MLSEDPALFDTERYIKEIEASKLTKELKAPSNKVPALNLPKLAPEKKVVPITIDVTLGKDFVLRDRFDWDLSINALRPIDFVTALVLELPDPGEIAGNLDQQKMVKHSADHLKHIKLSEKRLALIDKLTESVLSQIANHIDKNTYFPRQRLNKKEEDIISKQQVCVNCDSLLSAAQPDYCFQCNTQFDRRPNATVPQQAMLVNMPSTRGEAFNSNPDNKPIEAESKGPTSRGRERLSRGQNITNLVTETNDKEFQLQILDNEVTEKDGVRDENDMGKSDLAPQSWQKRMAQVVKYCNFSGKERKTCQKCQRVYPFFKTECHYCHYKFPKTRLGASTNIQTDSYTLQFWSKLRQDIGLFDSLSQLNEYLVDSDLMSVRDLYKKIKEVLSQENTERIFHITDTQLLDLHEQIDFKFEQVLTDNLETDEIFDRATIEKTQKRLLQQTCLDLRESLASQNLRMNSSQGGLKSNTSAVQQQQSSVNTRKRDQKKDEKTEQAASYALAQNLSSQSDNNQQTKQKYQFRPHNQELKQFEGLSENYKTMLNLGFLEQSIVHKNLGRHLNVPQLMSRPGRPVTIPVTYEDMMNVDAWDDSMLVFKKINMQGFDMFQQSLFNSAGQQGMHNDDGANGQNQNQSKFRNEEKLNVCGICLEPGKLICCDDCPGAFHADCLGYTKACPRGKWKCYFCKVIRHGIPRNVPRMAPNEEPVCDVLAETRCPSWEIKAAQLFDILEDYFCCKGFFEPLAIDNDQLRQMRKKKFKSQENNNLDWRPTSMTALRSRLDRKEFIAYEHLWEEVQMLLTSYIMGLPIRDNLHQKAQVTMNLLQTLVINYQIFELVTTRKMQLPSRAEQQMQSDDVEKSAIGGFIDKEENNVNAPAEDAFQGEGEGE